MKCKNCDREDCPRLTIPSPPEKPVGKNYVDWLKVSSKAHSDCTSRTVDWRERAIQAEDQLDRLGHKRGCIGGCGFEDAFIDADRRIYKLWHDLFPPDPATKPYIGDIVSEICISDEQIRLGVAGLQATLDSANAKLLFITERCRNIEPAESNIEEVLEKNGEKYMADCILRILSNKENS